MRGKWQQVPDEKGDFTTGEPGRLSPDAVRGEAERLLPIIVERMFGHAIEVVDTPNESGGDYFVLNDLSVHSGIPSMRIRIDAVPLPGHRVGRTFVNTSSENHVIHLSDRLTTDDVRTVLIEQVRTVVVQRRRARTAALSAIVERSADEERGVNSLGPVPLGDRSRLPGRFHYPVPGQHADGRRVTRAELPEALRKAEEERHARGAQTLAELRREKARLPSGMYPKFPVMLGAGAAIAARDPDRLVIDSRQRWHIDPIRSIIQSADQVSHLSDSGMGDPYQFADPRQRLPLGALRLWEDTLAAQGPLVNGLGHMYVDDRDRLLVRIRPGDGSDPVTVEIDGQPLIATGLTPESPPGCSRQVRSVPDAHHAIISHFAAAVPGSETDIRQALVGIPLREGAARRTLEALDEVNVLGGLRESDAPRIKAALQTLDATAHWDRVRQAAPGRVLFGDDVSDGRFDPGAAQTWIVAGRGAAGFTIPEILLESNPQARVTQIGGTPPSLLPNSAQYMELMRRYDRKLGGDGRLDTVSGVQLGAIEVTGGRDGELRFSAHGVEADGYVACLGRPPRLPAVLDAVCGPSQVPESAIRGELLFDDDRQYLGYHVSVDIRGTRHGFEVTGAASRVLPPRIFSDEDVSRVNRSNRQEAPPESGNATVGFAATAEQAVRLELHRAKNDGHIPSPSADTAAPARTGSKVSLLRRGIKKAARAVRTEGARAAHRTTPGKEEPRRRGL
jgi:hypothetical protein